ncbi:MAG: peptide chain release factor N(5)-glutamine methyltransferase [Acholeplasmataceae bacterium]|nr:peptide chain release factor N(5)-glutamine methyltransferase [Acholeplasmataceae bacterium]
MTYEALLRKAIKLTESLDKETEAVKFLLMETFQGDPHAFYMALNQETDKTVENLFLERLNLYLYQHVPIQHLLGFSYFFGYKFKVNKDVLIPRLETEHLVEQVILYYDTYFSDKKIKVLDLGCGSGCIGLTIKLEAPEIEITLSDISDKALNVAIENQKNFNIEAEFILSDLFDKIEGKYDIIVSNPPYIPEDEEVMDIVKKEPSVALYGGKFGLDFYARIIKNAHDYLNDDGLIAFEHGYQHAKPLYELIHQYYPQAKIIQMKDLAGKDRFTFIGFGGILK